MTEKMLSRLEYWKNRIDFWYPPDEEQYAAIRDRLTAYAALLVENEKLRAEVARLEHGDDEESERVVNIISERDKLKAALAKVEPVLKAIREVDKSIVEHALKHSQWGWCPDCQEAAKKIKAAWNIPQSWRDEEAKHENHV